jgi:hypothetical protein
MLLSSIDAIGFAIPNYKDGKWSDINGAKGTKYMCSNILQGDVF